jgi:hypothetical protein
MKLQVKLLQKLRSCSDRRASEHAPMYIQPSLKEIPLPSDLCGKSTFDTKLVISRELINLLRNQMEFTRRRLLACIIRLWPCVIFTAPFYSSSPWLSDIAIRFRFTATSRPSPSSPVALRCVILAVSIYICCF